MPSVRMPLACREVDFCESVASPPNTGQPDMMRRPDVLCEGAKSSAPCIDTKDPLINDVANGMEPPAHREPPCKARAPVIQVAVGVPRAPGPPNAVGAEVVQAPSSVHAGAAGDHRTEGDAEGDVDYPGHHELHVTKRDCTRMRRLLQQHKWAADCELEQQRQGHAGEQSGVAAQQLCCKITAIALTVGAVGAEACVMKSTTLPPHFVWADSMRFTACPVRDTAHCDATTGGVDGLREGASGAVGAGARSADTCTEGGASG